MLLRNPDDPLRNTSFIVIVIDSQKEVDIKLAPHFSQRIIGLDEIIPIDSAMDFLGLKIGD